MSCPGKYCGIVMPANDSITAVCTACPWGYRVPTMFRSFSSAFDIETTAVSSSSAAAAQSAICQQCTEQPAAYDWLYLGFMALMPLCLHLFFIEAYASGSGDAHGGHRRHRNSTGTSATRCQLLLHLGSAVTECVLAAVVTLLVYDPVGSLMLNACGVYELADWYTPLFNPTSTASSDGGRGNGGSDDEVGSSEVHCTQEAVYPLYTIVMVYYALDLLIMLLLRPMLASRQVMKAIARMCCRGGGVSGGEMCGCCHMTACDGQQQLSTLVPAGHGQWPGRAVYAALYFLPALVLVQTVLGGLLYYSYPYVTLVVFLITLAAHLSAYEEQSTVGLLKGSLKSRRNLCVVVGHCAAFAYGIVATSTTQSWQEPRATGGLLVLLVPLPYVFYVLTHRFTAPEAVDGVVSAQAVSGEQ